MNADQKTGRVLRNLPDKQVVVQLEDRQITARTVGVPPRRGADVLLVNPGSGWVVVSWY